jgi:hypothetical protein
VPRPLGQGHGIDHKWQRAESKGQSPEDRGGRRGSRTPKAHRSAVFETAAIANWLALPQSDSSGGRNRTCVLPVNGRALVPARAPPESISRGGRIRTGALLVPNQADWPRFPTPRDRTSAQRESNPHFRHGKAVGCRYIMGTSASTELSKTQSTGWDSNPHRRLTRAVSSPLDHQCYESSGTRGARTLTCLVKSQVCCR